MQPIYYCLSLSYNRDNITCVPPLQSGSRDGQEDIDAQYREAAHCL